MKDAATMETVTDEVLIELSVLRARERKGRGARTLLTMAYDE